MIIGQKIRKYRKLNGMTQKELGDKSGLSEIAIRSYESNKRNPKKEQLIKLSSALNIPLKVLCNDDSIDELTNSGMSAIVKYCSQKALADYSTQELLEELLRREVLKNIKTTSEWEL